jgi:glutamate-ammonia-ligase adenylyltransferase
MSAGQTSGQNGPDQGGSGGNAPNRDTTIHVGPLWRRLMTPPPCADVARAEMRLRDFLTEVGATDSNVLAWGEGVRDLLLALADHSPYLWRLVTADPGRAEQCLENAPETSIETCLSRLSEACDAAEDEATLMQALRHAKQECALVVALADLGGVWDVVTATRALSHAARTFIRTALRFLLRDASRAGTLRLVDEVDPERACGVTILAMGKLGAGELNYSSDVDLVVFYDPATPLIAPPIEPSAVFVRLTRRLVRILQERTRDGYVLRVDLRLRPDPGSTCVAISLPAAYTYYETLGQNWERAALIKACPVAGDIELGSRFLETLAPFIWRKYFDYAAIADIAAMKRQIQSVRGRDEIVVAGHDVKLGRGGIREIEFFVQTQQLIFGGKRPWLRGNRTLDMLEALGADRWVTHDAVRDLHEAYVFLRGIEHRLQMIDDEQTQRLPLDPDSVGRFARFCGYGDSASFERDFTGHLVRVSEHYAKLFEHAPGLDAAAGSLVFTGVADDPETLETLARLGFKNPSLAVETVRGWHFGHRLAVRTPRAREILTELVPPLLEAFAKSGDADEALANFDTALARMPAAVELFSILRSNPRLCELFGDILGGAPRLAQIVTTNPHVLDATIDPNSLGAPLDEAGFRARASLLLDSGLGTEDFLDALRDFTQDERFSLGLRLYMGMIDPVEAAQAYSALAGTVIAVCLAHVERTFAADHGRVRGGRAIVLGLGKLGSREMTAASDLDLILVYDFDKEHPESHGTRPLHAVQYYTRIAQRLVSALTVATRRGRLYEVDMRLRPSGRQGPLATQFDSFIEYQSKEAETWEHMALTRARVIAGDPSLAVAVEAAIHTVSTCERGEDLAREVADMRSLIAKAKGDDDPRDLKLVAGGLIDIEFIAQYLVLRYARLAPELLSPSTYGVIAVAGKRGFLEPADADLLLTTHRLYTSVTQILRLTLEVGADPRQASEAVGRRLAKVADLPGVSALEHDLAERQAKVRELFEKLLGSRV